jgi:glucose/arabinose dehydrogenase
MKKLLIALVIIVLVSILGFAGFKSFRPGSSKVADPPTAAQNYQNFCAGCHGNNLEKFAKKKWMDEKDNASVFKSIKYGLTDMGMPSFQKTFTDQEIEELAAFVKKGIPDDKSLLKPATKAGDVNEAEDFKFVLDTVVSGLDVPWGMAILPNGDMLISERSGNLYVFSKGKLSAPIEGVPPVMAVGQGGLLDICLHPDYAQNGWIYFSYSSPDDGLLKEKGNTAIMRARLKGNKLIDQQVLFKGTPSTTRNYHFGCKLAFDKEKHLFFGIGDRGQHFDFPQKLDNTNGKIHRINDDGSIPKDNPFANAKGSLASIYSFGHRNPQGTCINPVTGELWETEHGPKGGDELNLIKPGKNYGWPVISYGINYDGTILTELTKKEGMEQPLYYWLPSIAPCGMVFVTGDRYKKWQNNILIGSLRFKYLERVVLHNNTVIHTEKLIQGIGRIRNVAMGADGFIYVAIENPGKILRIVPIE